MISHREPYQKNVVLIAWIDHHHNYVNLFHSMNRYIVNYLNLWGGGKDGTFRFQRGKPGKPETEEPVWLLGTGQCPILTTLIIVWEEDAMQLTRATFLGSTLSGSVESGTIQKEG